MNRTTTYAKSLGLLLQFRIHIQDVWSHYPVCGQAILLGCPISALNLHGVKIYQLTVYTGFCRLERSLDVCVYVLHELRCLIEGLATERTRLRSMLLLMIFESPGAGERDCFHAFIIFILFCIYLCLTTTELYERKINQ